MDGTKFFGSNKKSCSDCLKSTKGKKTHSFHSGAVMSTVGIGPKMVIGFEMYKPGQDAVSKDEGELNVAKRLLSSTMKSHKGLLDVVVYDALACNSIWITTEKPFHNSTRNGKPLLKGLYLLKYRAELIFSRS